MALFPFETIRSEQKKFMDFIEESLEKKKYAFAHAPTGLGKTAASLSVLLPFAKENNKKVLFLTSRLTHHKLVSETVSLINSKFNRNFKLVSLLGKRNLCSFDFAVEKNDFYEFCKKLREENMCRFYIKTYNKGKLTVEAKRFIETTPMDKLVEYAKGEFCPYEILMNVAKSADIIVCDYNYVINPDIRMVFLKKLGISLEDVVIVFDEAHNLPKRLQNVLSGAITKFQIDNAILQLRKYGVDVDFSSLLALIQRLYRKLMIQNILQFRDLFLSFKTVSDVMKFRNELEQKPFDELNEMFMRVVAQKRNIISEIPVTLSELSLKNLDSVITSLQFYGKEMIDKVKKNYVLSLARNLELLQSVDSDYFIYFKYSKDSGNYGVYADCLDPSKLMNDIKPSFALFMSGTLKPVEMFQDLLGFPDSLGRSFNSAFPKKNKLEVILTGATSVYSKRSIQEYKKIAEYIDTIVDLVPGNVLVFFPSYSFLYAVEPYLNTKKKVFSEHTKMTTEEKNLLLHDFFSEANKLNGFMKGSVLLAVSSGNFSEGVDFPGDLLKAVVVVGIPLEPPTLKVKAQINYINKKFKGKGQLYAYVYPAMIKIMQNAGRCIRSETDRGMIFYIDSRYKRYHLFDDAIVDPDLNEIIPKFYSAK